MIGLSPIGKSFSLVLLAKNYRKILWIGMLLLITPAVRAETLSEALARTYQDNPRLAAARAILAQRNESHPLAISGWMPKISLTSSITGRRLKVREPIEGQWSDSLVETQRLGLEQTLFKGGGIWAGVKSADAQILAGQANLLTVEQSVLLSATQAYLSVLHDQAAIDAQRANVDFLQELLSANEAQFQIGDRTAADVSQTRARLASAQGRLEAARAALDTSRATYREVTGTDPGAFESVDPFESLPSSAREAVRLARLGDPAVKAAVHEVDVAESQLATARAALLPSLAVQAAVQREKTHAFDADDSLRDAGQVGLVLTMPLYQSGAEYSKIRSAKQALMQKRAEHSVKLRAAEKRAVAAWNDFTSASAQRRAYQAASEAANVARKSISEQVRIGLRVVVDLLDAEADQLNAKLNLLAARRDYVLATAKLRAALGTLTASELGLDVIFYDADRALQDTRWKLFGTDLDSETERGKNF